MAVLLAGIAIMGIFWTMLVPVWKQSVQREKEAELVFRAGQYARAVALYQRKYANAFPPTVDVLLKEKFLRKKYQDPITNGAFRLLSPLELQAQPGMTTTTGAPGLPNQPGAGGSSSKRPAMPSGPGSGQSTFGAPSGNNPSGFGQTPGGPTSSFGPNGPNVGPSGGIAAVVSRSSAASIRVFKNRRQYNQWIVTVQDVMPRSAAGTPQPGQQPGQTPSPFGASPQGQTTPGFGRPNP